MSVSTYIQSKLPLLKQDLTRAETYIKTVTVAVLSGAATDVLKLLSSADHEALLFTHAGVISLQHTFVYGAAASLLGLFVKSPLTPATPDATPKVNQ